MAGVQTAGSVPQNGECVPDHAFRQRGMEYRYREETWVRELTSADCPHERHQNFHVLRALVPGRRPRLPRRARILTGGYGAGGRCNGPQKGQLSSFWVGE